MKNICVFGASSTSGLFDFESGGWCDLLKRYFMSKGISIFNLGVGGNDTFDLLERFDLEAKARDPSGIIFALGGNDTQFLMGDNKLRVSEDDFRSNFTKLINNAKLLTKNVIVIGLSPVDEEKINSVFIPKKNKYYKNKYLEKYNSILEKIAKDLSVKFIDVFDILNKQDFYDGLHPTTNGHKKLFDEIKSKLKKEDFK